jgi:hypothetical protein
MKKLLAILAMAFASTTFAADAPKKPAETKKAATETKKAPAKCVPSKEVVCDKNLKDKTRPTPKKKEDTKTTK